MSCLDCGLASKGSGLFQLPKITGIRFQAGNVSQLRLFICQAGEQGGDEKFTLLHSYIRSSRQKAWNKMSLIKSQLFTSFFFASKLWLAREVWSEIHNWGSFMTDTQNTVTWTPILFKIKLITASLSFTVRANCVLVRFESHCVSRSQTILTAVCSLTGHKTQTRPVNKTTPQHLSHRHNSSS